MANLCGKLDELSLYPIGLSVDSVESHQKWLDHLAEYSGKPKTKIPPIIADPDGKIASLLGLLDSSDHDPTNIINGMPLTVRSVFVLDHLMNVRAIWTYPAAIGRSWAEIFRVVEALQLSDKYPIATPEAWTPGSSVLIRADMNTDKALSILPEGSEVKVPIKDISYVRFVGLK